MSIGFIGTGTIAEAVVTGLLNSNNAPKKVIVSPRNTKRALALESKFTQVEVANNNQADTKTFPSISLTL